MAEIKSGIFAKNVQKRINRAQEKVLQKLGKADETKDEQFEQVVVNFKRQEQASINLSESLHEVYEPDWYGKDDVMVIGKGSDALWEDFHNKLVDSTLLNLDGYLQQFPDLKVKKLHDEFSSLSTRVAKRSRKLIDYDSARHHMETLQASGIKNDRKMVKAEEDRVGFYVNTFKNVTSLEAKFHREISLLCKQLYEVMMKLGEQHSDKMFTIQGAPSDSGPLRLIRTPSPPDDSDDSPPTSPEIATNHMLRPASPAPARPKSPLLLRKGPPVPPPPKLTPSCEVAQEQIIDLFGGEFLPAPTPSQPNERPGESLLDLDFDAFQPDDSVSPAPQATDGGFGFVANWSADFGSSSANGDGDPFVWQAAGGWAEQEPEASASASPPPAAAAEEAPPQPDDTTPSSTSAAPDEVSGWAPDPQTNPDSDFSAVGGYDGAPQPGAAHTYPLETKEGDEQGVEARASGGGQKAQAGLEEAWEEAAVAMEDRRKSTPGLRFTNEHGEEIEGTQDGGADRWAGSWSPEGSGSECETAEEWGDVGQGEGGWAGGGDIAHEDKVTHECWAADDVGFIADGFAADWSEPPSGGPTENQSPDPSARGTCGGVTATETTTTAGFTSDDPFAKTPGGGFDADPFSGFEEDPFAQKTGGFTSDPFADTPGGDGLGPGLEAPSPTDGHSAGDGFVADFSSDPFAQTPEARGAHVCVVTRRPHREPESSDMSEDEAANRRYGRLYQEIEADKDEEGAGSSFFADFDKMNDSGAVVTAPAGVAPAGVAPAGVAPAGVAPAGVAPSTQEVVETKEAEEALLTSEEDEPPVETSSPMTSEPEGVEDVATPTAEEPTDPFVAEAQPTVSSPVEVAVTEPDVVEIPSAQEEKMTSPSEAEAVEPAQTPEDRRESPVDDSSSKTMPIPSVVIEPASSNEGDDDRDVDILSPVAPISNNGVMATGSQAPSAASGDAPGLPDGFLYRVETMHDFEAANSDELELKRGDMVLVVPTALLEDQDAGWLTGFKESEWKTVGASAQRGLFPENFTQRVD
ncbi:hypothetical protein NHX12_004624 [Muraenolepis orangiensis]|uniref:SH3 domain-containing protein n=1 Tax=Muraenolepis orangiensis TaxID=630683 RepID=A0A9Q0DUT8_9TELE|nr:hypothetical protein NHX12_004624 [Muraenolepis orangiensis]